MKKVKQNDLPKGLNCKICKKSGFSTAYKLQAHLFIHRAVPSRFKCSFCAKEYFRADEYSRHLATHTKNQKLYYCDHCGRGFVDKRNLIQHLHIHDDITSQSNKYTCAACGVTYCEERLLKYHIGKEHANFKISGVYDTKNLNETWVENINGTKNYVQITKVKPTMMKIKKFNLNEKNVFENKTDKVIYQQYIASVFASKDNYYSKAICDYCGKEMLKKSILPHIRERHLKLRRFQCQSCDRTFKRHYHLCLHNCEQVNKYRVKKKC